MKNKNIENKGVIVLYSDFAAIIDLSLTEKGEMFQAIIEYAENGVIPEFNNPYLSMAWNFFKRDIDTTQENHKKTCLKNKYTAHKNQYKMLYDEKVREALISLSFEDWLEFTDEGTLTVEETISKFRKTYKCNER